MLDAKKLNEWGIPFHMHDGVMRYYNCGIIPGDFLRHVLYNDLMRAFMHADDTNKAAMESFARMLYHLTPACFGSKKIVEEWSHRGGYEGILREEMQRRKNEQKQ